MGKFRFNIATIVLIPIEYFICLLVGSFILAFFQGIFDPYATMLPNGLVTITAILLTIGVEYLRQRWLNSNDEQVSKYGAHNYGKYEDVLDRYTIQSVTTSEQLVEQPINIYLGGQEADILQPDEKVYYSCNNVLIYLMHTWTEKPAYMTTNQGVTFDISSDAEHEKWQSEGLGTLYITNRQILFYSPDTTTHVYWSLSRIYSIRGHADVPRGPLNSTLITTAGNNTQQFYLHPADSDGNWLVDKSISKPIISTIVTILKNSSQPNALGQTYQDEQQDFFK